MAVTKAKSASATTSAHAWWVLRGNWIPQGRKIAGPFTTRDDAFAARAALESFAGGETFWIDSEPANGTTPSSNRSGANS